MPASQHEVADFQQHLSDRLRPLLLDGEGQSRHLSGPEQVAISDRGSIRAPIVLHLHMEHVNESLRGCVDRWHKQARATNGLLKDYDVIFLQLARYETTAHAVRKDRTRVVITPKITIPVFGRGLKTFRATSVLLLRTMATRLHRDTIMHYSWSRALCPGVRAGRLMTTGRPKTVTTCHHTLSTMVTCLFWHAAGSPDEGSCSVHAAGVACQGLCATAMCEPCFSNWGVPAAPLSNFERGSS